MEIFKIAGIGIAATVLAVFIKNQKPEFAIQISLLTALIIFAAVLPYLSAIVKMFESLADSAGLETAYIGLILKVIGIAYVAQFASELCHDAGEGAIASKIELAAKIIIMTLSMPVVSGLLETVREIINFE